MWAPALPRNFLTSSAKIVKNVKRRESLARQSQLVDLNIDFFSPLMEVTGCFRVLFCYDWKPTCSGAIRVPSFLIFHTVVPKCSQDLKEKMSLHFFDITSIF